MTLKIEFEEQVWAQIIDMLSEHPYKRTGAIINTMAAQIQAQRPNEGQMVPSKPNGGDRNVLRE
jgi:hypothetical protein